MEKLLNPTLKSSQIFFIARTAYIVVVVGRTYLLRQKLCDALLQCAASTNDFVEFMYTCTYAVVEEHTRIIYLYMANIPLPIKCEKRFDMNLGSLAHTVWWLWGECVVQMLRQTLLTNRTKWFISVSVLILRLRCYCCLLHDATQYDFMSVRTNERIKYAKLNWICIIYIKLSCASTNIIYFIYCLEFLTARQTISLFSMDIGYGMKNEANNAKGDVTVLLLDLVCLQWETSERNEQNPILL